MYLETLLSPGPRGSGSKGSAESWTTCATIDPPSSGITEALADNTERQNVEAGGERAVSCNHAGACGNPNSSDCRSTPHQPQCRGILRIAPARRGEQEPRLCQHPDAVEGDHRTHETDDGEADVH